MFDVLQSPNPVNFWTSRGPASSPLASYNIKTGIANFVQEDMNQEESMTLIDT